jgi:DNA-binding transcriptional LysR family regulator
LSILHLKEVDANLLVTLDALLVDASVTRAAERLGRSPSAISHALAKLRELFDDELFVRAGQRLVPTARAQELAPTVHVILAGMESLLRPNKPFDPSLTMRAFAAASSEAGELILIEPLRKRLQESAPSVRVDWAPSHTESLLDDLRNGRCHFVIDITGESAETPDIRAAKLFDDELVTLARLGHPLLEQRPDADGFGAAEHIAVHGLPSFHSLEGRLAQSGRAIQQVSLVSSALVGVMTTLGSNALLTLPGSLARHLERQFDLARIPQPMDPVTFPVRLLWHTSYDRDECHQWLREEFASLAQGSTA